jgi:TRAP-type C4-dicarboxylate transport system permease small subunit
LTEGWIASAALDDTEEEPAKKFAWSPSDNPLFSLDNCFITPHVAYYYRGGSRGGEEDRRGKCPRSAVGKFSAESRSLRKERKMKKALAAVSGVCDKAAKFLCILFFAALVIVVAVSVLFRYVLIIPMVWAEQAACYISIWIAFVAASIAFREKAHIGLDILVKALPGTVRRIVTIASHLLVSVFLVFLVYWGLRHAIEVREQSSPVVFGISMFWPYLALPFADF